MLELAEAAEHRSDFLKALAAELCKDFRAALVAVESSQWSAPMMLVSDELLSQSIDRVAIRGLLETATASPIACDVPFSLRSPSPVGGLDREFTRGFRIELSGEPNRTAVLLVCPIRQRPTAQEQLRDLKTLDVYARSTQAVLASLAEHETDRRSEIDAGPMSVDPAGSLVGRESLRLFHRDLDFASTNERIANESRRLLGCDRVTMLVPKGSRYRVAAISGVSTVDGRSNSVRSVERLTKAAAVMARPLVFPGEEPLPPQIQEPLDDYFDETGVMSAVVLPLHSPDECVEAEGIEAAQLDPFSGGGEILGVIVLEYFSTASPPAVGPAVTSVACEAALSLRNATEHRTVFALPLWKAVGRLVHSGRLPLIAAAVLVVGGLLAATTTTKVDHYVVATGIIEPVSRRQVFAAVDGIVKQIHVRGRPAGPGKSTPARTRKR